MSNYINNISIYGMMNKLAFFDADLQTLGYYKKKDKTKVVYFNRVTDESVYKQINYMYLDEDPCDKRAYSSEQITSIISDDIINSLEGKHHKELRETRNKYLKIIEVKPITIDNQQEIVDMIEEWRYLDNGGWKYGFNEHASIDKTIVDRFINTDLKEHINAYSFYIGGKCVGYSTIEKTPKEKTDNIYEYKYLTRKVLLKKEYRNLTEFIDWYTFKQTMDTHKVLYNTSVFLVNWGCSSGGVHWYKTHKWPLYKLDKKWFLTIKNEEQTKQQKEKLTTAALW